MKQELYASEVYILDSTVHSLRTTPKSKSRQVKSKLLPASKLKLSSHIHMQSRVAHHTPKHHAKHTPTIPP